MKELENSPDNSGSTAISGPLRRAGDGIAPVFESPPHLNTNGHGKTRNGSKTTVRPRHGGSNASLLAAAA